MWKVYDAQGNYTFVHHLIDVKDYLKIGYVNYEKCNSDEDNLYKSKDEPHSENVMKSTSYPIEGYGKFTKCKCFKSEGSKDILKCNNTLTVIASGSSVFEDINKFGIHGDIAVVNDAAFYYPEFNYFITVHGKLIPIVKEYRECFRSYYKSEYQTHSAIARQCGLLQVDQNNADFLWEFSPLYRSSGMLAIWIGIALKYNKILVHGMPFDLKGHFYDFCKSYVDSQYEKMYKMTESNEKNIELMRNCNVRFSSGKLADLIGKPTKEWLNGN